MAFAHDAQFASAIVGLRTRDVVAPGATAVHAAGEAAREDLDQRRRFRLGRRRPGAGGEAIEELPIAVGHRGDVLGLLLAPLDLEAADTGLGDLLQVVPGAQILRGNQVAAVELGAGVMVGEHVVLSAGLRARAAIGASLGDHPRHEALAGIRDAQRTMHERLEAQLRHRCVNGADVVQRVLASEHHALDAETLDDACAGAIVHGHLRRAVNLEPGIHRANEAHGTKVLHDRRVDAGVNRLAEMAQRVGQFSRLEEDVEGEVDARPLRVRDATRFRDLAHGELRALVTGVEALRAQIDGVRAIGDGGPDGVEGTGGGEEFGDVHGGKANPARVAVLDG